MAEARLLGIDDADPVAEALGAVSRVVMLCPCACQPAICSRRSRLSIGLVEKGELKPGEWGTREESRR